MDMNVSTIDGACHCGTVRFRVRLTNGLHTARRCHARTAECAELWQYQPISVVLTSCRVRKRCRSTNLIRKRQSISFAQNAASTPITNGDPILINTCCLPVRFESLRFRGCCRVRWRQSPCRRLFFEAQSRRPSEIHYRAGGEADRYSGAR